MASLNTPHMLVIGGTGFIGHHLLKAVQHKYWQVTSVSLTPPTYFRFVEGVRYLHFDMSDLGLVKKYISEDYDFVVNLGGYINHQLFRDGGRNLIETHFTTLQNLVETISRRKLKRFVQIGSSDEYGNAQAPQHENLREQPISPYSLAKVGGTHFLQMLHRTEKFPAVILRLFLTYGPGQDANRFLPQIIRGCLDNNEFPTSAGEQYRDFCYVEDTIRAILKALVEPEVKGEVFNVASGEPVSIRTMITKVCSLTGSGKPQFGKVLYRPGENMNLYANIKKIQEMLSWSPQVSLEQGLQKTINWYAEHE
jgi:nucleoside-diphosphate-sugar epimerase